MAIFYQKEIKSGINELSEEESKHCAQVLRCKPGDLIEVFDGKGGKYSAALTKVNKRATVFDVQSITQAEKKKFKIHIAIAPTKNMDRMEWLVEKLSELDADEITFIETAHSERRNLRLHRLEKKAISAMKQSGNPFLLKINPLTPLNSFLALNVIGGKFIAHVSNDHAYLGNLLLPNQSVTILIGPEGDFNSEEVGVAIENGYQPISLGESTLRTETAGLVACCMVRTCNGA